MKKLFQILLVTMLIMCIAPVNIFAENNSDERVIYYFETLSVEEEKEIILESLYGENEFRSGYDPVMEHIGTDIKATGYKLAGGQLSGGVNFGNSGGVIHYKDGTTHSPISMTFGVSSSPSVSFSLGVGEKVSYPSSYSVNVGPNMGFVKLYANQRFEVRFYKLYHVYPNGQKVFIKDIIGQPIQYSVEFSIRK